MTTRPDPQPRLLPWRQRLIVYAVLVMLALAAIWIIDGHVMQMARPVPVEPAAPQANADADHPGNRQ